MTNSQLALGIILFVIPLAVILIFWYSATYAPTLKYYCGFCNRAWGHYPNGRLYHQAVERADRFDYWPLVCFRCQCEQHKRELRASSREAFLSGNTHQNLTRPDAATDGCPRVRRGSDGSAEYWPKTDRQ